MTNQLLKYADDSPVLGLITNIDNQGYLEEAENLTLWCQLNKHL